MSEIEITKSASSYLKELLEKQDENTVGIKIFVTHPGTPRAETCIAYTKDIDDLSKFVLKENQNFNLYFVSNSFCAVCYCWQISFFTSLIIIGNESP